MPSDKICKTVRQYNKELISEEDMGKLQDIAADYSKVKNYVYQRYGGIGALSKLYPGYTIQNEMTASGLREKLDLPSVYFYLAVFDAIKDIKSQWTKTKAKVLARINKNEGFNEKEKHYLRFLLKTDKAMDAILQYGIVILPESLQKQYYSLLGKVDSKKLDQYLRRQIRWVHLKPHTGRAEGFSIGERAYRYADGGIYLSIKEKRKRIFVALTDKNQYNRQLYVKLYPKQHRIELKVPIDVKVKKNPYYNNELGVAIGMVSMLTTDKGHVYGEKLGEYQKGFSEWVQVQTSRYYPNRETGTERKKYQAKKHRIEEQIHSYINQELNCFLRKEQPKKIYMAKLPKANVSGSIKQVNFSVTMWQRGYIRKRLRQKCEEQSIQIVEVFGKGISKECSKCGKEGKKKEGKFICPFCGHCIAEKTNTACNAKKRGEEGQIVK